MYLSKKKSQFTNCPWLACWKICLDTAAQTHLPSVSIADMMATVPHCGCMRVERREEEEKKEEEEEGLKGTALMACLHTGEHTCRRRCQITAQPVLTNYQLRKVWGPCVFSKHRCRTTVRGNHQPQWKVGGKMFGHINIVMLCFN